MEKKLILICPTCNSILSEHEHSIKCDKCSISWDVLDGIPCFSDRNFYWGEIPKEQMCEINKIAESDGWETALELELKSRYPNLYKYVMNESRADWRFLLPITPQSKILDLGSGWGTLAFSLVPYCGQVVCVEAVYERTKFCRIRQEQENIQNIQVIAADTLHLPLPDTYFDVVILNGLLEWVGLTDEIEDPLEIQKRLLRKIHNLLRPNGWIYIGIENRFGYNNFLGATDHSGLKYTSLMPRKIADIYSKVRKRNYRTLQRGYRTYTHSFWKYKNLLKASGFSEFLFFMPIPGYNQPKYLIPFDNPKSLQYYLSYMTNSKSLKRKVFQLLVRAFDFLPKFLSTDFSIIACKRGLND